MLYNESVIFSLVVFICLHSTSFAAGPANLRMIIADLTHTTHTNSSTFIALSSSITLCINRQLCGCDQQMITVCALSKAYFFFFGAQTILMSRSTVIFGLTHSERDNCTGSIPVSLRLFRFTCERFDTERFAQLISTVSAIFCVFTW